MAEPPIPNVRILESLKIKIGEAKNLNSVAKDYYCCIKLDQEEVYRTATQEKTECPFWAEECEFGVPKKFRILAFYVYERDRLLKRLESIVGKVALRRDELHRHHGKEQWLPLTPVDPDSEVQGKVHVEVRCGETLIGDNGTSVNKVAVRVIEGSNLTIVNRHCDTFATVTFCSPTRTETKKTKIKRKSDHPQYDETFLFELVKHSNSHGDRYNFSPIEEDITKIELKISVWNNSSSAHIGEVFIGEVKIPLSAIDMSTATHKAWYFLKPRENSVNRPQKTDMGSLRVRINYLEDQVFPSSYYNTLRDIILKSPEVSPTSSSGAYILGQVVRERIDAARPLVRLFYHHDQLTEFTKALAKHEIAQTSDANTIFRGNSLGTKCIDEYMKLEGMHYLHDTLKVNIDEIHDDHRSCEIDPTKLRDGEVLADNLVKLKDYVEKIFMSIVNSAMACPRGMCKVFYALKEEAKSHFPNNPDVKYSAVSGFVFLRFFAPAILSPRLFKLRKDNPDTLVARTLTLISKAIQTLGNHVKKEVVSPTCVKKESYMVPLYDSILDAEHVTGIRRFLDIVSSSSNANAKDPEAPIILKEGYMIKRAQGRKKLFAVKNFKKRWFRLTNHELTYSKGSESSPLCTISVDKILAVEQVQEDSFHMQYMFQVIQPERVLYVQANNSVDEKQWGDVLSNICRSNHDRLMTYHPAAYINGQWMCCKCQSESVEGCTPASGSRTCLKVDVDSDREMERIHSLFLANIDKLEKMRDDLAWEIYHGLTHLNSCVIDCVYQGPEFEPHIHIEDHKSCYKTVQAIMNEVIVLEQEHKKYMMRVQRETEYGSEHSPIGDDNYMFGGQYGELLTDR
ncbi:ras GTPase-activating protein 3-like isoform X2 [Anneissia japonica]|uniref:ras GTPase-activating protein 3-like isoform X2 n=1 Tax=Anneissia japonica TaxID=1529436 RepID=UPI0014257491|nr:ras GTPase-activating protein 3-like isoform X2 [Anneissia japonica]